MKAVPQAPERQRRRRSSPVWVIVALLLGSAVLRGAAGYASLAPGPAPVQGDGRTGPTSALESGEECRTDPELAAMMREFAERRADLETRAEHLALREATLRALDEQVRQSLARLADAERALSATMARAETAAESDIARLTAVYEKMKPKEAAELFGQMAPDFAAGFLARMRPDAAAAIMANLKPRSAYAISVVLAGRNANAPEN